MRLLLVDDEQSAIDGLLENLKRLSYSFDSIHTANSKAGAQAVLSSHPIDLLICDVEMPNGDGLELLEWVREHYPQVITIILSCHDEFSYAQRALRLSCFDYLLKPATADVLYPVMERVFQHMQEQKTNARVRKLGESYVEKVSGNAKDRCDPAEKIRSYLDNHLTEEISVGRLAQMMYMSPDYLNRCFKRCYACTITEYIMDKRLSLAAEMLVKKDMSITMIAAKVGYPNYTYFIKVFKKKYGVPPAQYRSDLQG